MLEDYALRLAGMSAIRRRFYFLFPGRPLVFTLLALTQAPLGGTV